MKLFKYLAVAFFLSTLSLFSSTPIDDEEIVVCLETENRLVPIYVSEIMGENPGFDANYLKQLLKVLEFDLNQNGMTETVKHTKKTEALLKGLGLEDLGSLSEWKAQNIPYVIKIRMKSKNLEARLFFINGENVKSIEGLSLSGDLNSDRRKIHILSDMIHQALFNTSGIAKHKFLYVVKERGLKGEYISNIFEADYDGYNARQITKDEGYCITPIYVPPKKKCAPGSFFYVSYKTGQSKIYMASLKDGIGSRFNDFKGNQLMPAITSSRDKVAFISDYTGNPDLFLQPFSPESGVLDKPQQIFALKHATQGSPSFSPDGKKIAFVSNKDGSPKVYVMSIPEKGSNVKDIKPQLISKLNRENSAPIWSPDGLKLAYCSMVKGFRQIFVYDFEKNQETQVTTGSENKENPTFASNSLHLIFNSTGKTGGELYLMNLNQPKAIKISKGLGEKHFPSFQP